MSRKASYRYSANNTARRRAEWAQRTSALTSGHLTRFQAILDDMRMQGLDGLVPSEFEDLSRLVERARSLSDSDPAAAREISMQIGPRVGPLPRTARQLRGKRRTTAAATQTPEDSRRNSEVPASPGSAPIADSPTTQVPATPTESPAEAAWRESLADWTDFLARDLAFGDLAALRQQIKTSDGPRDATEVKTRMEDLRSKWVAEAEKQRREQTEIAVLQERPEEDPLPVDELRPPDVGTPAAWDSEDPEDARRQAVRAVMGALEDAGFQVASPRLVNGEVIVVGSRPSGASATFNLTLDGSLEYDFSGYRGSSCDADIDTVVPALRDAYGIQLTDEVIAWRNPDDEDATARPQPGRTRHS